MSEMKETMRLSKRLAAALLSLALLALVMLPLGVKTPSLAAGDITLNSSVQYTFPTSMTFKVSARSDANVTSLRLHYVVDRQNVASVVSEGWAQFTRRPRWTRSGSGT